MNEESNDTGLFTARSMNEWLAQAASRPVPRKLFGNFWAEGELSILFADTGIGKSALATQVAHSICTGQPISDNFEMEATSQPVLYCDFELSEMQLQKRYAIENREGNRVWYDQHYPFSENLRRVEINGASRIFDSVKEWEPLLIRELDREIRASDSKIAVVDNISFLAHETDKGKVALPLMQRLNDLKRQRGLSMMVLAHTPKLYHSPYRSRSISIDDLAGSKILSNLADSIFAIGRSKQDGLRYLKQLKARSTDLIHGADNVAVFRFEKHENFLGFEFVGFGNEHDHLVTQSRDEKALLVEYAKMLSAEGKSQREIAKDLGISVGAVNKYLKL